MSSASPWDQIRLQQSESQSRRHADALESERQRIWTETWREARERLDEESLIQLASLLNSLGIGFWLDYRDLFLARTRWIHERHLWRGYELSPGYPYTVGAAEVEILSALLVVNTQR